MLRPNTSRSRVRNLDHHHHNNDDDDDDDNDNEYDGHYGAHSMESSGITTKTLPRRIYQPQPQRRRTNCCVSRCQSNGVPRQGMARVVVRLISIVWMAMGTFIYLKNPTNHDRRHGRRRRSSDSLLLSSLLLLRWWWLPNPRMMTMTMIMMMMTCTTVMVVVQADWIDPDTPEQYYSTQPLTTGDEREFQLVRCFLLSFHTHTTISRYPLFWFFVREKNAPLM